MSRLALALAVAAGAFVACNGMPPVRIPQADQAIQATHGGGERLRIHQRCVEASTDVEALVRCMDTDGYHFVPRTPGFPGDECWAIRDDTSDESPPPPHCFEHAPDAPH